MPDAFDAVARTYDSEFTNSEIGKLQRKIVWDYLTEQNIAGKHILEINCGTGEDAVFLAKKINTVFATDSSEHMLAVAQKKIDDQSLTSKIELAEWDLNTPFPYQHKKFDIIFSNFGGLNCISPERLKELSSEFHNLLNTNGRLIFVIMGRFCLMESIYFLLKGKFSTACRRRAKGAVNARINENTFVDTWYYSPAEIIKLLDGQFEFVKRKPVGVFIPPGYLEKYFANKKWLLKVLKYSDICVRRFRFLSNCSDHYCLVMCKKISD